MRKIGWPIVVIVLLILLFFGANIVSFLELQDYLEHPRPYSAEYAHAIDDNLTKEITRITPGLYSDVAKKSDVTITMTFSFNTDGTFQLDVVGARDSTKSPVVNATLIGVYQQTGAVLILSKLVGDQGLLPQQGRILLKDVSASNLKYVDWTNGSELTDVRILATRRVPTPTNTPT